MDLTPSRLKKLHEVFLGHAPNEVHAQLYDSSMKGFLSSLKNTHHLEAVTILALAQAWDADPSKTVFFFAPSNSDVTWSLLQLREIAQGFFTRLKAMPTPKVCKLAAAQRIGEVYNLIRIGVLGPGVEQPERWVAFGFDASAKLPLWMRNQLVEEQ